MKDKFKFVLKLYKKDGTLSPENGLSLADLSEIFKALSKAIELEDIKCTINDVENKSQDLMFITDDERGYHNYTNLWENIKKSNGKLNLRESQQDFGRVLYKQTRKGICFAGIDNERKEIAKVEHIIEEGLPKHYFVPFA